MYILMGAWASLSVGCQHWSRTIYKFLRTMYKMVQNYIKKIAELYIKFALFLPIVHVPLMGNICLRSPPNSPLLGLAQVLYILQREAG